MFELLFIQLFINIIVIGFLHSLQNTYMENSENNIKKEILNLYNYIKYNEQIKLTNMQQFNLNVDEKRKKTIIKNSNKFNGNLKQKISKYRGKTININTKYCNYKRSRGCNLCKTIIHKDKDACKRHLNLLNINYNNK